MSCITRGAVEMNIAHARNISRTVGNGVRGGKRAGMGRVVEISVPLGAYKHLGSKTRVRGPRSSDRYFPELEVARTRVV